MSQAVMSGWWCGGAAVLGVHTFTCPPMWLYPDKSGRPYIPFYFVPALMSFASRHNILVGMYSIIAPKESES